jgi:dCMP deaminase
VVKNDRVISIGYNGMPTNWDNNCEHEQADGTLVTRPEVLHAETNALAKLARSTESGENSDIFITHTPCLQCAKLIYQAGIRRVFHEQYYRDDSGVQFLRASGIPVIETGE